MADVLDEELACTKLCAFRTISLPLALRFRFASSTCGQVLVTDRLPYSMFFSVSLYALTFITFINNVSGVGVAA